MAESQKNQNGDAFCPADFGWQAWKRILLRSRNRLKQDRVSFTGAAVALFCLLGLIPLLTALVGIFGLIASEKQALQIVDNLQGMAPPEALSLLRDQMLELTSKNTSAGIGSLISFVIAIWGGSKAMDAFMTALNVAYHEKEKRNLVKRKLIGLALTLGTILVVSGGTTLLVWAGRLSHRLESLFHILNWPMIIFSLMLWLSVLYRYGPSRKNAKWRWVSHGSIVATILWVGASFLFSLYVRNFGNFNETYGSLGAVIVLIMWLYLSAIAIIIGAEINSEMELQTARDTTRGECQPIGERGAYVADHQAENEN